MPLLDTSLAQRSWIKCLYENKDITNSLEPYLKSFSFSDANSGQVDSTDITLEDTTDLWKVDWLPSKGAVLKISIMQNDGYKTEENPLGIFEIDEITCSGPPDEVKIKAVAVPDNSTLRGIEKSHAWEKTYLSIIAKDIADNAAMKLFYKTEDIYIDRAEQTSESDLSFLLKLCSDNGLALKTTNDQIVIFNEIDFETAAAIGTITKEKHMTISYDIKSKTRDIYAACHVKYQNGKSKRLIEYTFNAPNKSGKTLEVNEEVKTIADAEKLAKKKLREKNKDEITVSFTLYGSSIYATGNCFNISGFGKFDSKYIIDKATHDLNNGYTCNIEMHKCLEGY